MKECMQVISKTKVYALSAFMYALNGRTSYYTVLIGISTAALFKFSYSFVARSFVLEQILQIIWLFVSHA